MPSELLYKGTIQDCTDYAKKLIDEIGYVGAFCFAPALILSYPVDAKRENLIAVNEFVADYERYS